MLQRFGRMATLSIPLLSISLLPISLLSISLTAFMAKAALGFSVDSRPDILIGQTSNIQNFDWANQPYCYMQTSDGRVVNLERLCGTRLNENRSTNRVSSGSEPEALLPVPGTPLPLNSGSRYAADNR